MPDSVVVSVRIVNSLKEKAEKAAQYDHLLKHIDEPTVTTWLKWLIERRIDEIKKGG